MSNHKMRTGLADISYSGYFSGGKLFVSSEFLASLGKSFRGHGN